MPRPLWGLSGSQRGHKTAAEELSPAAAVIPEKSDAGNAGSLGSLGDGSGDSLADTRVKCLRNDIVGAQLLVGDQVGKSLGGSHLHFLVDVAGANVERTAEDAGERQNVVDLVRIVAAAGGNDGSAARLCLVRENLRRRVRAGKDDRLLVHGLDHFLRDHARSGNADEHVGALELLGQRAGLLFQVRDLGHFLLDPVQAVAASIDRALAVAHGDVLVASGQQQLHNGDGSSACAGGDDLDVLLLLADNLQRVRQAGEGDDGGAVLIVMEDGDVALFLQLALDLKAARCGDILEVDAAEAAGDVVNGLDEGRPQPGLHPRRCTALSGDPEGHQQVL